jgi:hypothetical protein
MVEAEEFHHDLTMQFGLLSDVCKNEKDFIKKSVLLIAEMITYDETEMEDLFFGEPPSMEDFHFALSKILNNISKL